VPLSEDASATVGDCLREAAQRFIIPFADPLLRPAGVEKTPGEIMTIVDTNVEAWLTEHLPRIGPNYRVVGEEHAATDPKILRGLATESYWLVDPLDGTANFVEGTQNYGTMVALVESGQVVNSWILQPSTDTLYRARINGGAWRNGGHLTVPTKSDAVDDLVGDVLTRFLPEDLKSRMEENTFRFKAIGTGTKSAAVDYPNVANGSKDFVVYWRVLPWDHVAGALLLREAGGTAIRMDRSNFPDGKDVNGLVIGRSSAVAERALTDLLRL
jgi:fructose-1,6-bisphosphatase/inositol monophosphatase family enzyme